MKKHLKRLKAPKFWKVPRKKRSWVVRPSPGPHKKFESIPLLIVIRDFLNLTDEGRDARKIIKANEVLVDGKPRKDHKYPVGLFDAIEIPKIGKRYRVVPTSSGLDLIEIPKKEASLKFVRINDKTMVKEGKLQLNLHDGKNLIIEKKGSEYKTGDSLLIELPSQKIVDHLKMDKGMLALIVGGENMGKTVTVNEVIITKSREANKVICEKGKEQFETIKDYVFVVGKTKPLIKIE